MAVEWMKSTSLYCLAPEPEGNQHDTARFGEQLAEILNWDQGLPDSVKRRETTLPLSTGGFLEYTRTWCLEKAAQSFAIVRHQDEAVGLMSLSHIDLERKAARTGMFLASRYVGQGIPAQAFFLLLKQAKTLGIRQVSGAIPELENIEAEFWRHIGATIDFESNRIIASLHDG
ncbi:MAG: hypothetical protein HZA67_03555 [Rhodospirillales bacterium]|nr:hypothetical protein [Rhodospirillales bacterium]